eukprot:Filipodium_phascolosomae@DN1085_c0_g1_i2.p1
MWNSNSVVSTTIRKLDECLNGGLHGGLLYEVVGPSGVGKSIFSLSIAALCLMENLLVPPAQEHVCDKNRRPLVAWIDGNQSFSANQMNTMLARTLENRHEDLIAEV